MGRNIGGYIRGPWWKYIGHDDEKTRRCFVIAWGHLVKDPKETYKNLRTIRFVLKTGRGAGRNEKHLACVAYGEELAATIMSALEKNDVVAVFGTWTERPIHTKKGEKSVYECTVNFVVVQALIGFLLELFSVSTKMATGLPRFILGLYQDERLREIAEKNLKKYDEEDPWEGD